MATLPPYSLAEPHATLVKFGFPRTCLHLGEHWAVLVRPAQVTLGSLVLCSVRDIRAFGDLPSEAFAEQGALIAQIEQLLTRFSRYEKINYLMLMMVDPQVHFHVLPRYEGTRSHGGGDYPDSGWPGFPDLARTTQATEALVEELKSAWKRND